MFTGKSFDIDRLNDRWKAIVKQAADMMGVSEKEVLIGIDPDTGKSFRSWQIDPVPMAGNRDPLYYEVEDFEEVQGYPDYGLFKAYSGQVYVCKNEDPDTLAVLGSLKI